VLGVLNQNILKWKNPLEWLLFELTDRLSQIPNLVLEEDKRLRMMYWPGSRGCPPPGPTRYRVFSILRFRGFAFSALWTVQVYVLK
jgi:hypothetical protein